ncbi:MAG: CorA family divalent cation transporter, partial [Oscillospiraceae bacterium]
MTNYYISKNEVIEKISQPENGCWISMVNPSETDLSFISQKYDIDLETLVSALDIDERSRIESDEHYTMILVNIPTIEEHNDKELFNTIPLSIIVTNEVVITVCS